MDESAESTHDPLMFTPAQPAAAAIPVAKTALMLRSNLEPSGGQMVWRQWFDHINAHPHWQALLFVTPEADWPAESPWADRRDPGTRLAALPQAPDLVLLEGLTDWPLLPSAWLYAVAPPRLHLIQHLRHADPADDRSALLPLPAIRVAVSEPVTAALAASGRCCGPLLTIPPGLALPEPAPAWDPAGPVIVLGLKNPGLAQQLGQQLAALQVRHRLLLGPLPRAAFLESMSAGGLVVALPMAEGEGFFLPALEAMALGRPLLVPDAGGTRAFCRDGVNCLQPAAAAEALTAAVLALLGDSSRAAALIAAGLETAGQFSIQAERQAVHGLLDQLPQLWAQVPVAASC
jgi:hypothetical protein